MINKYVAKKKISVTSSPRNIQIKTTVRFHLIPTRMAISLKNKVCKNKKYDPSIPLLGTHAKEMTSANEKVSYVPVNWSTLPNGKYDINLDVQ